MAFQYPDTPPQVSTSLHEHFGHEVELINDAGEVTSFIIKKEFIWGNTTYIALQGDDMKAEEEVDFLKVIAEGDEIELESISDDDEWEAVSEAYDDLMFSNEERP